MRSSNFVPRFWSKVNLPSSIGTDECWMWQGGFLRGYGSFSIQGKTRSAHRVSYELAYGPIPAGLDVLHSCDHPSCVNPDHLWLGTQSDNGKDMAAKGRAARQTGEQHGNSRLTEEQALYVLRSPESGKVLADRFGVSKSTVCHVRHRRTWRHLVTSDQTLDKTRLKWEDQDR